MHELAFEKPNDTIKNTAVKPTSVPNEVGGRESGGPNTDAADLRAILTVQNY